MWSDGLLELARQTRDEVADALSALGVHGELGVTGGASVPGALTKGDIDLHLRVAPDAFRDVVARLRGAYPVASPLSWAATLAVFDLPGHRPTGLAVTPVDSEHDRRFGLAWRLLRDDPQALAQYNSLKSGTPGAGDYERRKSAFFSALASEPPESPDSAE